MGTEPASGLLKAGWGGWCQGIGVKTLGRGTTQGQCGMSCKPCILPALSLPSLKVTAAPGVLERWGWSRTGSGLSVGCQPHRNCCTPLDLTQPGQSVFSGVDSACPLGRVAKEPPHAKFPSWAWSPRGLTVLGQWALERSRGGCRAPTEDKEPSVGSGL